jgi:hypothetical protein
MGVFFDFRAARNEDGQMLLDFFIESEIKLESGVVWVASSKAAWCGQEISATHE